VKDEKRDADAKALAYFGEQHSAALRDKMRRMRESTDPWERGQYDLFHRRFDQECPPDWKP